MDLPSPPQAVAALAAFVRDRLAEVSDAVAPLWTRREDAEVLPAAAQDGTVVHAARQLAMVIAGAAAPFAPTSYSRARLIRQMHASGLLSADEVRRTELVLEANGGAEATVDQPAGAAEATPADRAPRTRRDAPGAPR